MKDTYGQIPIQFFIVQLSALFPSQHQFFNYCISTLSKREDFFNMYQQFLMYQLHRINIIRQSSVSKEVTNELIRLESMADESISTIRGFWAEMLQTKTDFNAASLGFIRKMAINTKSCYIDAIEKFPNSTQILNSYCRFLCESCGNYIECIRIGERVRLIELGRFENTDFCFRFFVNVFPHYLKKKILDSKGSFIYSSNASNSSQSTSSISSTKLSASFDNARGLHPINDNIRSSKDVNYSISIKKRNKDEFEKVIEQENFDSLINNLFTFGKSRLSIQHIVDRSSNFGCKLAFLISLIQTFCFVIVICLIFSYVLNFKSPIELVENSARISNLIFSLQYCSLIVGIQYLSEIYNTNISSNVIKYLNIRDENMPRFPCTFYHPMLALDQNAKKIIDLLDDTIQYLIVNPDEHKEEIRFFSGFSSEDADTSLLNDYSVWDEGIFLLKFKNGIPNSFKTSLRNGFEYFESFAERLAYEYTVELNESILLPSNQNHLPPPPEYHSIEVNSINKDSFEDNSINKDSFEKNSINKDSFEEDSINKDSFEENSANKNSFEENPINKDSLENNSINKDSFEENPINKDSLENNSINKDSLENNSINKDSLERNSINKDSLERNSINKDSLENNSTMKNSLERNSFHINLLENNSLEENSSGKVFIEKDSLTKHSLDKHSLKKDSFEKKIFNANSLENNSVEMTNQPNLTKFHDLYFDLLMNGMILSQPFFYIFDIISENGLKVIRSIEKSVGTITISMAVVCFVIFFMLRLICYIKIRESIKGITNAIKKVKCEDIIETMKPIFLKTKKGIKIHSNSNHSIYESSTSLFLYPFFSIISIIFCLGFFLIITIYFQLSFEFIGKAQEWENENASRFLSLAILMNSWIAKYIKIPNFTFSEQLMNRASHLLDVSQKLDLSIIAKGKELTQFYFTVKEDATISSFKTPESKSNLSAHSKFNAYAHFLNANTENFFESTSNMKCTELDNGNLSTQMNLATYLDCISIENKINFGIHFYSLMKDSLENEDITESSDFITSLFILDKYLYRDLPSFQDKIFEITKSQVDKEKTDIFIIGTVGIFVVVVIMLFELLTILQIHHSYSAFKQLIMVLPPTAFSRNSFLVNFLVNSRSSMSLKNAMKSTNSFHGKVHSEEEILINSMDEGLICTDKNLVIQSVNPAISKMTGFLADQLLGQVLLYLIPLSSKFEDAQFSLEKHPFYQRIGEIQSNSGDRVAEVNAKLLTDKGEEVLTRATLIGIFDKKKINGRINSKSYKVNGLFRSYFEKEILDENDDGSNSTTTATTTSATALAMTTVRNNNNLNENNEIEEFVGITIILKDISNEKKIKRDLKIAKRQNETLLNLLIPQPVLERIRESRKPAFYTSKMATLIKFELTGFDEYIGAMVPKQIMTTVQIILSGIDEIGKDDNEKDNDEKCNQSPLFIKHNHRKRATDNDTIINNFIQQSQNSLLKFNFTFDPGADAEFDISKKKSSEEDINIDMKSIKSSRSTKSDDSYMDFEDHDDFCDFSCIYNIRNDNDQAVLICGLFDTQNDLKKQAESCVRYALRIKQIVENIGLEDQINMLIHTRIAVCMGGPMNGFVDNPENPQIQIFSSLLKEADTIKNNGDVDLVYINENVYKNLIKGNYEIEEKVADASSHGESDVIDSEKIYIVNKCLKKKKSNEVKDSILTNAFEIADDYG